MVVLVLLALGFVTVIVLLITNTKFRHKVQHLIRGLAEGLKTVFSTKQKGAFLFHTIMIWALYLVMFWVGFFCIPETSSVGIGGVFAGFIAGSLGIILVQGGIGVYPAFVALIVGIYMVPGPDDGLLIPQALAMGWLLWVAQTILVIE